MEIKLLGKPESTNHIYKRHGNFIYLSKEGKTLKESYAWQIKSQYKGKPLKGDIDLRVELFFGDNRIRDIDNYNKILLDSAKGLLWEDDKQIMSLLIIKNKDIKNPRVEMTIN